MTHAHFNRFPLYVDLICPYTLGKIWFLIEFLGSAIFAKLPLKVRSNLLVEGVWNLFPVITCPLLVILSTQFPFMLCIHAQSFSVGAGGRGESTPTDFLLGATSRFPLNLTGCACLCWRTKVVPIQITLSTQARGGEGSIKPKTLSSLIISPIYIMCCSHNGDEETQSRNHVPAYFCGSQLLYTLV